MLLTQSRAGKVQSYFCSPTVQAFHLTSKEILCRVFPLSLAQQPQAVMTPFYLKLYARLCLRLDWVALP